MVEYAVYVKNHTPCDRDPERHGWTPYELFENNRYTPEYRQFGLDVVVALLDPQEANTLKVALTSYILLLLPVLLWGMEMSKMFSKYSLWKRVILLDFL